MVSTALSIRPLSETFGAEVMGVTLSGAMDSDTFNQIQALWLRYELLLFRDQAISKNDQVGFTRLFGPLERHVREEWLNETHPEILHVTNMKKNGKAIGALGDSDVGWHYDQIYMPTPAVGSLLYAVTIPDEGGSTFFSDMTAAYLRLPQHLKTLVEGRTAIQSFAAFNALHTDDVNKIKTTLASDIPHPLVRTHPVTGRKALYLCPGFTTRICGLPEDESAAALEEILEWCIRPEFIYRHDWQLGDALLWDNACTMHRRDPFDGQCERLMHRTTILPEPQNAVPF